MESNFFSKPKDSLIAVTSFEELFETLLNLDSSKQVLLQALMDKQKLVDLVEKLLMFGVKIDLDKHKNGWLFTVERG